MAAFTWANAFTWEPVVGGVEVLAETKSLVIASLDVNVSAATNVSTVLKGLTVRPFDASVDAGSVLVNTQTKALTIAGLNVQVDVMVGVEAETQTKSILISPFDAFVQANTSLITQLKAITISPANAVVSVGGQNYVAGGLLADIQSDLASIVQCTAELGSIVSINGVDTSVMMSSGSIGSAFDQYEAQAYETKFWVVDSDLVAAGAMHGTTAYYKGNDYTIAELNPDRETGLTLVYLKRS